MKSKHKKLMLRIQRCTKEILRIEEFHFCFWTNPPIKYNPKIFDRLCDVYYNECKDIILSN